MPVQPEELLTSTFSHADALQSKQEARLDLAAEVLHRFGEVRFVAHGSSMIPSIYPGDLLTVRSESIAEARTGEIVLFLLGGRFFVHRVRPVAFASHRSPWTKFLRWGVQNSPTFARTLLAAHVLRSRILGSHAQQTAGSPGK